MTLFLVCAAILSAAEPPLPTQTEVDHLMAELAAIAGMPVRHHLRFQSITKAEVGRYLEQRARETVRPEELAAEQAALIYLGFLPEGFDLRKATLDLMTEQAAAFYDYDKKALFLSDWAPEAMRSTAVIHELAHALADQNFHLGRYLRKVENDSERSTARQAVVEGQASYLMEAYAAVQAGQSALGIRVDREGFDSTAQPTSEEYPVFDRAPLYLRVNLVFPYTWGLGFQAALVEKLGTAGFSELYRRPPVSTRQILHPEQYLAGEKEARLKLPRMPRGFHSIYEGELGELDHRVLIQQYVSIEAARKMSPQWRAGGFRLIARKGTERRMLLYTSEWADEASGAGFLKLYRRCLEGKAKEFHVTAENSQGFSGSTERGYFRVQLEGTRVSSREGMEEAGSALFQEKGR